MAVKALPIYQERLKEIAPFAVFSVTWSPDNDCRWDGDPDWDPEDEGFQAYNTDVKASCIYRGEEIYEEDHLGGTWEKPDEIDPEIGGFLPQMLREAAERLSERIASDRDMLVALCGVHRTLCDVQDYLKGVMRARYDQQQLEKHAE